jgi:hypothetical protein
MTDFNRQVIGTPNFLYQLAGSLHLTIAWSGHRLHRRQSYATADVITVVRGQNARISSVSPRSVLVSGAK